MRELSFCVASFSTNNYKVVFHSLHFWMAGVVGVAASTPFYVSDSGKWQMVVAADGVGWWQPVAAVAGHGYSTAVFTLAAGKTAISFSSHS